MHRQLCDGTELFAVFQYQAYQRYLGSGWRGMQSLSGAVNAGTGIRNQKAGTMYDVVCCHGRFEKRGLGKDRYIDTAALTSTPPLLWLLATRPLQSRERRSV